jgi:hypothetical protein
MARHENAHLKPAYPDEAIGAYAPRIAASLEEASGAPRSRHVVSREGGPPPTAARIARSMSHGCGAQLTSAGRFFYSRSTSCVSGGPLRISALTCPAVGEARVAPCRPRSPTDDCGAISPPTFQGHRPLHASRPANSRTGARENRGRRRASVPVRCRPLDTVSTSCHPHTPRLLILSTNERLAWRSTCTGTCARRPDEADKAPRWLRK